MAKLPSYRRVIKTDYPAELQDVIETLALSLNPAIDVIFETLNKRVTLRDNIKSTVKDVRLTVDSNGKPTFPTSFTLDVSGNIDGCVVLNATNQTNTSAGVQAAPFISFSQNNNNIIINNVKGLIPNNEYTLRILAFIV